MKKNNFLVISGGNGFIGKSIIGKLKNKVIVITRNPNKFKKKNILYCKLENFEKVLKKKKIDFFIHCRKLETSPNLKNIIKVNFLDAIKIIYLCEKYNVKKFINIDTNLNRSANNYSFSKYLFREYCKFFSQNSKMKFVNVRLTNVYGKNMVKSSFINLIKESFKKKKLLKLTSCNQKKYFTYIDDVVNHIIKIIKYEPKKDSRYKDILISHLKKNKLKNVIKIIEKILKKKGRFKIGALKDRKNDNEDVDINYFKRNKMLMVCKTDILNGLKKTL